MILCALMDVTQPLQRTGVQNIAFGVVEANENVNRVSYFVYAARHVSEILHIAVLNAVGACVTFARTGPGSPL